MSRLTELRTVGVPGLPDIDLPLMPVTALVGPRGSGKSRVLASISWLLTGSPSMSATVEATLEGSGGSRRIARTPADAPSGRLPACTLLPATDRLLSFPMPPAGSPEMSPAEVVIAWVESRTRRGETGSVLLIEEPELDLNPQTQRYFYRVLRDFARENQVIYSTRSPSFVDAVHHQEIRRLDISGKGMEIRRAPAELLTNEQRLRLSAEFDHERAEMFFAHAVVLVEGETERQALPIIFRALGQDPDALGIAITEVGGKGNLLLAARLLGELHIPHLIVHDTDRGRPGAALNKVIARDAHDTPRVWLDPDFEGAAGIRGHKDKVLHAWERFAHASSDEIPLVFHRIVDAAVSLARGLPLPWSPQDVPRPPRA